MRKHLFVISLALMASVSTHVRALSLGSELLANGNAELGSTQAWVSGGVLVAPSSLAGSAGVPAGSSTGNWVFSADPAEFAFQRGMTQRADVSMFSTLVDAQQAQFHLSGLLMAGPGASVNVFLSALDVNGARLFVFPGLWVDFSSGANPWQPLVDFGVLPPGTRGLEVLVSIRRFLPSSGGYLDNVSLTVSEVPEPNTVWMFIFGAMALGARRLSLVQGRASPA